MVNICQKVDLQNKSWSTTEELRVPLEVELRFNERKRTATGARVVDSRFERRRDGAVENAGPVDRLDSVCGSQGKAIVVGECL